MKALDTGVDAVFQQRLDVPVAVHDNGNIRLSECCTQTTDLWNDESLKLGRGHKRLCNGP